MEMMERMIPQENRWWLKMMSELIPKLDAIPKQEIRLWLEIMLDAIPKQEIRLLLEIMQEILELICEQEIHEQKICELETRQVETCKRRICNEFKICILEILEQKLNIWHMMGTRLILENLIPEKFQHAQYPSVLQEVDTEPCNWGIELTSTAPANTILVGTSVVQPSKHLFSMFESIQVARPPCLIESPQRMKHHVRAPISITVWDPGFGDEGENCFLVLEKMGVKNARKMGAQIRSDDAKIKALTKRIEDRKRLIEGLRVSMWGDLSIVAMVPTSQVNDPTKKLFSQPFFLEKYRYMLCLQVSMDGIGGSLSVFVHIMKGDFDSILDWPFRHRIAIKVKNQQQENDIVHIVQPESTGIQKPEVDQNITFGSRNFPTYSALLTGGFVRDDSISIECEALWN